MTQQRHGGTMRAHNWVEHWRYKKVQIGEKHIYLSWQLLFPKAMDHRQADQWGIK